MVELDFVGAVDAGGAVGGSAVFRPRLALGRLTPSQHVHADRDGHRRRLYLYSVIGTLFPRIFPAGFRDAHGAVAVYFEAAAVITVLVLLGQVLELRARERTSGAIRALLGLAPKTARRITDHGDEDVSSMRSRSAIACACGPVRKFRSTALSPKGIRSSMNRW